jgi:monoamine oxidase
MDVVIIGAGLSGLTAAATLQEAGISVQVLEADAQIGGRIRSVRDSASTQAVADLGPTWVWPKYQPVVARWLSKLDIKTFDQFNEGNAVITGYGPEPFYQPLPGQDGMVRIVGGPTTLIDTLSERLGSSTIRTGAVVAELCVDGPERINMRPSVPETLLEKPKINGRI